MHESSHVVDPPVHSFVSTRPWTSPAHAGHAARGAPQDQRHERLHCGRRLKPTQISCANECACVYIVTAHNLASSAWAWNTACTAAAARNCHTSLLSTSVGRADRRFGAGPSAPRESGSWTPAAMSASRGLPNTTTAVRHQSADPTSRCTARRLLGAPHHTCHAAAR